MLKEPIWSSSETSLDDGEKLSDFNENSALTRMEKQLEKSNILTKNTQAINLNWSIKDISRNLKQYTNGDYVLLFPFCSKKHQNKKWPFFKDLISQIRREYKNNYSVLIAPGPNELTEAKELSANIVLDEGKPINIKMLISLINGAKFIVSNDTGPAHIASHLKKNGLVLFGSHTTAKKVSIENKSFKAISVENLSNLNVDTVMGEIQNKLN